MTEKRTRKPRTEAAPAAEEALPMFDLAVVEAKPETLPEVSKDLEPAIRQAAIILLQPERFDPFYEKMKEEVAKLVPDTSTPKGREAIRKLAFRVTKTKTTIDAARLALTEDWRSKTAAVNADGKSMKERLEELATETRKPLTDWEAEQEKRREDNLATLQLLRDGATIRDDDTSETVHARGLELWAMTFEAPQWDEDQAAEAEEIKVATVKALAAAKAKLAQSEADARELEELRALQRQRAEQDAREDKARGLASFVVGEQESRDPDAAEVHGDILTYALKSSDLTDDLRPILLAAAQPLWTARRAELVEEKRVAAEAAEAARVEAEEREARAKRQREETIARATIADIIEALAIDPVRPVNIPTDFIIKALRDAQLDPADEADAWVDFVMAEALPIWTRRREAMIEAERAAADKARKEAEEAAAERQREADEAAAAAQRESDARAAAAEAEATRLREAEEERKRVADAERAEADRLAKNKEHARKCKTAAKEGIIAIGLGVDDDRADAIAQAIVRAIIAGEVPHVTFSLKVEG